MAEDRGGLVACKLLGAGSWVPSAGSGRWVHLGGCFQRGCGRQQHELLRRAPRWAGQVCHEQGEAVAAGLVLGASQITQDKGRSCLQSLARSQAAYSWRSSLGPWPRLCPSSR